MKAQPGPRGSRATWFSPIAKAVTCTRATPMSPLPRRSIGSAFRSLRVHDLRHSYATALLTAGVAIKTVADLLGHADATMVLRTYGHTLAVSKREAANVLEGCWHEQRASARVISRRRCRTPR